MDESAFTAAFCDFVRTCVPSFEAAAVLVCLVREPKRSWSAAGIVDRLHASVSITVAEVERSLELLGARGLVARSPDGSAQFRPSGYLQEAHARTLVQAYEEKPVTLVQLIYALRDDKIRSFSDAFRFRS
ncbi:MAG TPA: hypothetical protein VHN19_10515 [Burkholderiales bacterium]|jgi:hypothetical protein|nr:hypothetical protein [Burkholderiales bacterium]